jgi:phosphatidylethanolamine/phosphatidyl-N-methylethanolamine N-methyltransferase
MRRVHGRGGNGPPLAIGQGQSRAARLPLSEIARRYDRVARFYRLIEPLFLIHTGARRRAVAALKLNSGNSVLEIGCGTGRNFPYLSGAIGPSGSVIGVDASAGMLAEARRLSRDRGWANVQLINADASRFGLDEDVDGILFSLSYSVLPDPVPAAEAAWRRLRPGGRLVVMDAGLPANRLGQALRPVVGVLLNIALGNPDSRPWDDLAALGPVTTERFMSGLYYTCVVTKPARGR